MHPHITQGAIKIIELVGVSTESFDDAVRQAVKKAASTLDGITGIEVEKFTAKISDNRLTEYHANIKLAFVVK